MHKPIFVLGVVALASLTGPASAHHSLAMYDTATQITIEEAVVEEFEWTNPHCWLYILVKDENGVERAWTLESNSTGQLTAAGWSAEAAKPGDVIRVVINPLKDGTRGGRLEEIHHADGRVFSRTAGSVGGAYDPRTGELY